MTLQKLGQDDDLLRLMTLKKLGQYHDLLVNSQKLGQVIKNVNHA